MYENLRGQSRPLTIKRLGKSGPFEMKRTR